MVRSILIAFAIAVVAMIGYGWWSAQPKGTDLQQLTAALNLSTSESKKGEPGGVLDVLSNGFALNGTNPARSSIAQAIRKYHPDVQFSDLDPIIEGDQARVTATAHASISALGSSATFDIPKVTLFFHRETDHVWLVFPAHHWKLVSAQVPDEDVEKLQSLGSFMGL